MQPFDVPHAELSTLSADSTWAECREVLDSVTWPTQAALAVAPTELRQLAQQARASDRFIGIDRGTLYRVAFMGFMACASVAVVLGIIQWGLPWARGTTSDVWYTSGFGSSFPASPRTTFVLLVPVGVITGVIPATLYLLPRLPTDQKRQRRRSEVLSSAAALACHDYIVRPNVPSGSGATSPVIRNLPSAHWLARHADWIEELKHGASELSLEEADHSQLLMRLATLDGQVRRATRQLADQAENAQSHGVTPLAVDRRPIENTAQQLDACCGRIERWRRWLPRRPL